MNLAARLDRLRGQAPTADGDVLGSRLQRLQRRAPAPCTGATALAPLQAALCAERHGDGLLWRDFRYALPAHAAAAAELSMLPETCDLPVADWVYIDTETTGLSGGVGNLAFMVGVARDVGDGSLAVRQFVLGGFAGEAAMLQHLRDWVGSDAVLVSYNGKCFDLPLLAARFRLHRIAHTLDQLPHLDLMYGVRRAYRRLWPDCRLQTAERRLLGLHRHGDLPGSEAPAAWRAWLDSGDAAPLQGVLRHNLQDVASLALLHRRLADACAGSTDQDLDHAAIARAWRDAGQRQQACCVLERAGARLDDAGRLLLASLYRQRGHWSRAEALWLALHARGNPAAALELSKYYEHRRRDYRMAFDFAACCEETERERRCDRLLGKVGPNPQLRLWDSVTEFSLRTR